MGKWGFLLLPSSLRQGWTPNLSWPSLLWSKANWNLVGLLQLVVPTPADGIQMFLVTFG